MNTHFGFLLKNGLRSEMLRGVPALSKCSSISELVAAGNYITSLNNICKISTISIQGVNKSRLSHNPSSNIFSQYNVSNLIFSRSISVYKLNSPCPRLMHKNLKFRVHYPEDGKYTVVPLKTTKLAGRDPETGKVTFRKIGGGHKQKFRWVDPHRTGPKEEDSFLVERVINIQRDPIRTGRIALVGEGTNLRYLMATENMKAGDLIKTTSHIYRNPVRPSEGDAYPLASLPFGTVISSVERRPGEGAKFAMGAGTSAVVLKKQKDRIAVRMPSKRIILCNPECMATVGRMSNIDWNKEWVGSAQRRRWLGMRPQSGFWNRKDGYCGRKIKKKPPPLKPRDVFPDSKYTYLKLNHSAQEKHVTPTVMLRRKQSSKL